MTRLILLVVIGHALLALALIAWPAKAHAFCPCGSYVTWSDASYSPVRRCYRCRYQPRVYGWRYGEDDEDRGRHCRDTRAAVGDQHLTLDGAKKAANDAWAAAIRFHIGEKFMSLENARHLVYTCSRSSIKEGGSVTTLGQILQRCELRAQPCAPLAEMERRDEDR